MKTKNIILPLGVALATVLFSASAKAQSIGPSTYNNTGGSGTIGTNSFDWSVGEISPVGSYISSAFVVTQGVLQPFDTTASSHADVHNTYLTNSMLVYPTPADNTIYLQPSFSTGGLLEYRLQDLTGKVLASKQVKLIAGNEKQSLNMTGFAVGVYMLNIVYKQGNQTYTAPYKIQRWR